MLGESEYPPLQLFDVATCMGGIVVTQTRCARWCSRKINQSVVGKPIEIRSTLSRFYTVV